MSIVLRNMAQVTLPEDLKAEILKMFIHRNNIGEHIRTYRYKDGVAYLPPNMNKLRVVSTMTGFEIEDRRSGGEDLITPFVPNPAFTFRPHQAVPAEALYTLICREKYGVLKAGCGCGKTVTMAYVAGKLECKTLILVDMGSLQSQWQDAFRLVWGREAQIINRDTVDFSDVCIVTFQLLHRNPELVKRIRKMFGCILLDEFHTTAAETYREVLIKMDSMYRIGCTATLMRKGYSDDVLTDMVSDRCVVMTDEKELKPTIYFVPSGAKMCSNTPSDWGKIQSNLGKDLHRNRFITHLAAQEVAKGRKGLVVGITINSLQQIMIHLRKYPECKPVLYIKSTTLKQDLELKRKLDTGEINLVLTVKKTDKGLDLPSLDFLILARPANNEAFVQQVVGRIVRPVEGKPDPIVIDLVDDGKLGKGFAANRKKWYLKLKYSIGEYDASSV